jgi:transcription elongation factor GreA
MARNRDTPIPITAAGLAALKAELAQLRHRRPSMVDRVASARSDGDLKENFAYHDARQDLGMLDGRVQTIEAIVATAVVADGARPDGSIGLGSTVVVRDDLGDSTYSLVGPAEADVARGMISLESPLGSALIERKVGETVTFESPGGPRTATIVKVD